MYDFGNRIFGIFTCMFVSAEDVIDDDVLGVLEETCKMFDEGVLVRGDGILYDEYFRMIDDDEPATCVSSSGRMRRKGPFERFVRWRAEGSESFLIFLFVFFVFFDIFFCRRNLEKKYKKHEIK